MATKLKVVFTTDSTGMSKDITEEIEISSEICLFCYHDSRLEIDRLHDEVKLALESKGYDLEWWFTLWKVYTI